MRVQFVLALLVLTATAYTIGSPTGIIATTGSSHRLPAIEPALAPPKMQEIPPNPRMVPVPPVDPFQLLANAGYGRIPHRRQQPNLDWITKVRKEIVDINNMGEVNVIRPFRTDIIDWFTSSDVHEPVLLEADPAQYMDAVEKMQDIDKVEYLLGLPPENMYEHKKGKTGPKEASSKPKLKNVFALTPLDQGFYQNPEPVPIKSVVAKKSDQPDESKPRLAMIMNMRQIRQNPNLSKQKNLLGPDLGKLKVGLSHEGEGDSDVGPDAEATRPRFVNAFQEIEAGEPIYAIVIVAALGATLTMLIFGFVMAWYTITRKAKAAADVDYPAYGVTGPTTDASGDRKLAQSAHMYHYQHQKQQIIAMERNSGLGQRDGSVSDPESEEENEEGDYTVYECPGFATTGDMEVKNPLFSDDPTPATPGKGDGLSQPKK